MDNPRWIEALKKKGLYNKLSKQRKEELIEKGFFPSADLLYDFDKYGYELYANDRDLFLIHPINGWFTKLIDDKRFIPIIFRNIPKYIPDLSIGIEKGQVKYILEHGDYVKFNSDDSIESVVMNYVMKYHKLFIKPAGLSGGRGAFVFNNKDSKELLKKIHNEHAYIINNYLENEKYARDIYPKVLNTIRIYFYRHKKDGVKIQKLLHKFGSSTSGLVDNLYSGGIACEINTSNGSLSIGHSLKSKELLHPNHIDTGHQLQDFIIPNWQNKLSQINEILSNLYFLEYGALDAATTPTGIKILEINSHPARGLLQCHSPAFLDEDFKEFFLSKGYTISK